MPKPVPSATPLSAPALVGRIALGDPALQGRRPGALALLGDRLYVAMEESNSVAVVAAGKVVQTIPVAPWVGQLVADPRRDRIYVLAQDSGLHVIAGTHVTRWAIEGQPSSAALVQDVLWTGSSIQDGLLLLSPEDGRLLGQVALGSREQVRALLAAPDGQRVYAMTFSRVYAVDVATRQVTGQRDLGGVYALAVSPDGERLYVTGYAAGSQQVSLRVLSARTLEPRQQAPLEPGSSDLVADPAGKWLYVLSGLRHAVTVLDAANLKAVATVPVGHWPTEMALDPAARRLYITNAYDDNVAVVDMDTHRLVQTIPLGARFTAVAADPDAARFYVADSSRGVVRVFEAEREVAQWPVPPSPNALAVVPETGQVAVLSYAAAELSLLGGDGQLARRYGTGPHPQGLLVDAAHRRLYAGDTVIDLAGGSTSALAVADSFGLPVPPAATVLDTTRDQLFLVVSNGVPGSNGGYVIRRPDAATSQGQARWGRLSVVDALYDAETDRFYSTWARMGTYGLQVADAADGREIYDVRLAAYPLTMALNPDTGRLWLALGSPVGAAPGTRASLIALETETLGTVAELLLEAPVSAMAVHRPSGRLYLASSDAAALFIVQDGPATAARGMARPTVTPYPTYGAPAQPTPVPSPTCAVAVDPALLPAWRAASGAEGLGCALQAPVATDWAMQPFERGLLLWRGDARTIFALAEGGAYRTYGDVWREGMPALSCQASAPDRRLQPQRGFGLVWC
ncbi:MAG: beta-propeller fold lactonase family protein, partial [Chloroflexota bacterium]